MQHRYFGDVGDFGKFGLLRVLSGLDGESFLNLGIVWYLYPNESHNADSKHLRYLQEDNPVFRDCDVELYDKLRKLLFGHSGQLIEGSRHITFAETSNLLPEDTVFYSEPLSYSPGLSTLARDSLRKQWFEEALAKTASADLIFLDPDNGIERASIKRTDGKGPKYVFWDEIGAFVERGQSVIVYHHLNRNGTHSRQVEDMLTEIGKRFGDGIGASAVTYKRGTNRAYFIIASPGYKDLIRQRLKQLHSGLWGRHRHFILHEKVII